MVEKPIGKDTQIREQESERDRKRERHHNAEMVCDFSQQHSSFLPYLSIGRLIWMVMSLSFAFTLIFDSEIGQQFIQRNVCMRA